ncbi:hypothetical protein F5141DRAFT_1068474 [Pisolithus sp. B1]|nr:hypothetical protein F5141DRAFT_1068474 [Pisolithus sp. B1]
MLEHEDTCPNGNANVSTRAAAVTVADLEMHLEVAHFQQEEQLEQTVMHSMKLCGSVKQLKVAKDFVYATLKDYEQSNVYSLCMAALIMYNQNHESRGPNPKALEEHKCGFQHAVETYQKALHFDPLCTVAAQGLTIATAEDALGAFSGVTGIDSGGNSTMDQKCP